MRDKGRRADERDRGLQIERGQDITRNEGVQVMEILELSVGWFRVKDRCWARRKGRC